MRDVCETVFCRLQVLQGYTEVTKALAALKIFHVPSCDFPRKGAAVAVNDNYQ